ncbi:cytochrome P450 [Scytonema sp. NUACC21]
MQGTYNLPDGPQIPLFVRLMKFIFQPLEYVEGLAKTYGDSFTVWGAKGTPIVYFTQPQALQQIFAGDANSDAGRGNQGLEFLMGSNSLLLLDGERHQRERQLLTPPLHGDRMRAYGDTICEVTHQVIDSWKMGKPLVIRTSMQEISLRVILRVVFGLDEGPRLQELRQLLSSVMDFLGSPFMTTVTFFEIFQKDLGAWSPWGWVLRQIQKIDTLIYALIQERRTESEQNRQDVLSLMMSARDEDGQPMTDRELRDELMTMLVAGHETTASALAWAFYWIDFLPEVGDKLLEELGTLGSNPDPTAVTKLPYLTAVCQETLRIYPIVMSALPRIVRSPIKIMGYDLPVGAIIIPNIYLAHHRKQVYPQPKQFRPERFLEKQFSPYEYMPFGGGNRRCIGLAFAQYEMKLVLATVLSRFQVSRVDKRPVRPVRRGMTFAAPGKMRMIATPIPQYRQIKL